MYGGSLQLLRKALAESSPSWSNIDEGNLELVPKDILVVSAKHLQTKVYKTYVDLYELVVLVSQLVKIIDTSAPSTKATTKGEKEFAAVNAARDVDGDVELKLICLAPWKATIPSPSIGNGFIHVSRKNSSL
ncbi:hypothetical protein Tco_0939295 [Tanacetum coccineum]|uniref:Uncharacterized protein n=1 Tax=Tanacetum coccineum TaxID=301880 RepID=A0ABQ5DK80_9ASTR